MSGDSSGCHHGGVCYWKHQVWARNSANTLKQQQQQPKQDNNWLKTLTVSKPNFLSTENLLHF